MLNINWDVFDYRICITEISGKNTQLISLYMAASKTCERRCLNIMQVLFHMFGEGFILVEGSLCRGTPDRSIELKKKTQLGYEQPYIY